MFLGEGCAGGDTHCWTASWTLSHLRWMKSHALTARVFYCCVPFAGRCLMRYVPPRGVRHPQRLKREGEVSNRAGTRRGGAQRRESSTWRKHVVWGTNALFSCRRFKAGCSLSLNMHTDTAWVTVKMQR